MNAVAFDEGLLLSRLTSRVLGRHVEVVPSIDSTNRWLADRYAADREDRLLLIAEFQTAGRGRFGREWEGSRGKSLLFSFPWRIDQLPDESVGLLTLAAGVAVYKAMEGEIRDATTPGMENSPHQSLSIALKYPNDLQVNGKKVAGILAEQKTTGNCRFVVMGIGINVNNDQTDFVDEHVRHQGTSLSMATGKQWCRESILARLINSAEPLLESIQYDQGAQVIQQYRAIPNIFGREVTVTAGATAIGGIAEGIDLGGALLVRKTDGSVIPLRSGEVTFQDMNGPEGTTDSNQ